MADRFQPYVGPGPFQRDDHEIFFGRDGETNELLSLIIAHDLVVLYAQSGAGKTSLVNAGLIPRLEKEGVEVLARARVAGRIPEHLDSGKMANVYIFNTLMNWIGSRADANAAPEVSLAAFLATLEHPLPENGLPAPRVVIFDQFEELFSSHQDRWTDRKGFFEQIVEALDADPLLRIVLVIREDYIAQLDPYIPLLGGRLRTHYRLERLRAQGACQAVEGPLQKTGRSFGKGVASGLVMQLLKSKVRAASGEIIDVEGEYVEPVQLQVVCQRLWANLPPDVTVITADHLQQFGDVKEALTDFFESAIEAVRRETNIDEGEIRLWFKDKLITPAGTRGTVFRDRDRTEGIPNAAVDALEAQHIIRAETRAGARWYELTHDRLIEPIRESNDVWFEAWREERTRRRIETERAQARLEEQAKSARLFRRLTAVLAIVCLLAVVFAGYAVVQRRVAQNEASRANVALGELQTEREIAFARHLAAQAEFTRSLDPSLLECSVLLAVESMRRFPSLEADQALRGGLALLAEPLPPLEREGTVYAVAFSPDGEYLATAGSQGPVQIWEVTSGRKTTPMDYDRSVWSVAFSADGTRLATGGEDGTARVWNVAGGELARMNHKGAVNSVVFSPDGQYLASASLDRKARVWPIAGDLQGAAMDDTNVVWEKDHEERVLSVAWSPDGRRLATACGNGEARVWGVATDTDIVRVRHEGSVRCVAFDPNGRFLATASEDGTARQWEVASGKEVARVRHAAGEVHAVAFSPDGKYLATAGTDKTARLWELPSAREIARISHSDSIEGIAFSPKGGYLATAGQDGTAKLSLWRPRDLIREACSHLSRNLTYEQWQQYLPDEPYAKTCPNLPVHPSLIEAGRRLARAVDIAGAEAVFRRAVELGVSLEFDPGTQARRLAAPTLVRRGDRLVRQGNIREALAAYEQARAFDPAVQIPAESWNSLGWQGCLLGHAADVIHACERAVELDPNNAMYRDTRGLGRALTGDYEGAADDFQFYVERAKDYGASARSVQEREAWIPALRAGRSPFDEATLEALRNE